jgi:hypothetical protein
MIENSCERCHYHLIIRPNRAIDAETGKTIDRGLYITCLIDMEQHTIGDRCDNWERRINVHDNQRQEDARLKRSQIGADKKHIETIWSNWKVAIVGIVLGAVLGIIGTLIVQKFLL